jgi:hypothetical protein
MLTLCLQGIFSALEGPRTAGAVTNKGPGTGEVPLSQISGAQLFQESRVPEERTPLSLYKDHQYVMSLCQAAGCSPNVSDSVVQKQVAMHAVAALYCASTMSRQLCSALLGSLDSRKGQLGLSASVDDLKASLEQASVSIGMIEGCVSDRVKGNKVLRRASNKMADALDELVDLLENGEKRMLKFAIVGSRQARQEEIVNDLLQDCKAVLRKLKDHVGQFEVDKSEVDVDAVRKCCNSIVRILAYSPALDEKSVEEVQKSIELRNSLRDDWVKKASNEQKNSQHIKRLQHAMASRQEHFNVQCATLERRVSILKEVVGSVGAFRMSGHPGSDKNAREIQRLWNTGDFKSLKKWGAYSTDTFTFHFDPNPTPRQEECLARYNEACEMVDELKSKHAEAMTTVDDELCELKAKTSSLQTEAAAAKKKWDDLQGKPEDSWTEFRLKSPGDFAQVLMCFKMQEIMEVSATHMVEDDTDYGHFRGLVRSLERLLQDAEGFDVSAALLLALKMKQLLRDADQTPVGFLANLPEAQLNRALQPRVTDLKGCEQLLDQFSGLASTATRDSPAVDGGACTPQLVDGGASTPQLVD